MINKTNKFIKEGNLKNIMKREREKRMGKNAQVTIFIILAIAIVIVLVILFIGQDKLTSIFTGKTPIQQIQDCVKTYTQEAVDKLSLQGGSLNPELFYLYQDNKVAYLCYIEENYKPCVMQKPLLKQSIEKEITTYASPKIKSCMEGVKTNLEKDGYAVSLGDVNINAELVPNNIIINIQSDFGFGKDTKQSYKSIKTDISSGLYEFAMIASSILNWEARYGDAETLTYMTYYPDLKVEKKKQGDGSTVYILTNRNTKEQFMFASRSYELPAGGIAS